MCCALSRNVDARPSCTGAELAAGQREGRARVALQLAGCNARSNSCVRGVRPRPRRGRPLGGLGDQVALRLYTHLLFSAGAHTPHDFRAPAHRGAVCGVVCVCATHDGTRMAADGIQRRHLGGHDAISDEFRQGWSPQPQRCAVVQRAFDPGVVGGVRGRPTLRPGENADTLIVGAHQAQSWVRRRRRQGPCGSSSANARC